MGFIYSLNCPITNKPKYVGQTIGTLIYRFKRHLKENNNNKKCAWIKNLASKNLIPKIVLIEEVDNILLNQRERHYIKHYLNLGYNLKNCTEGGEGKLTSEETRLKMRLKKLGKKQSTKHIEKSRLSRIGSKRTEQQKINISAGKFGVHKFQPKGIKHTEKTKQHLRKIHKDKNYQTVESLAQMVQTRRKRGWIVSEETKQKMRLAWKLKRDVRPPKIKKEKISKLLLTKEQIEYIRSKYKKRYYTTVQLGRELNVCPGTIYNAAMRTGSYKNT